MRDAIIRLWRLYQSPMGRRMLRYTTVSAISTVVSFVVLAVVYGALRLWTEVPSTLFANVLAGIPSYFLNRRWVWGKTGKSHIMKEVVPFWTTSITGILVALLAAAEARHFGITHHLHHLARTAVVLGANITSFAVLWLVKFLVFKRLFHVQPVAAELVEV